MWCRSGAVLKCDLRTPEQECEPVYFAPAATAAGPAALERYKAGRPLGEHPLYKWCVEQAAAGSEAAEDVCGRPLGIRLVGAGRFLYVADCTFGIFRVDLWSPQQRRPAEYLVPSGAVEPPLRFTNDLDVAPDGTIFFSDSSSMRPRRENRKEVLENRPNGTVSCNRRPPAATWTHHLPRCGCPRKPDDFVDADRTRPLQKRPPPRRRPQAVFLLRHHQASSLSSFWPTSTSQTACKSFLARRLKKRENPRPCWLQSWAAVAFCSARRGAARARVTAL